MNKPSKFIGVLYEILEAAEFRSSIRWLPKGTGFTISRIEEFSENILAKHFNTKCYQSFLRQLSMYGFKMKKNEKSQKYYEHPNFIRGKYSDLCKIQRRQKKDQQQDENNITFMRESNIQLKLQLERLKEQQSLLSYHLRLQQKIQFLITKRIESLINTMLKRENPEYNCQPRKTFYLFFDIIKGYQPHIGAFLAQPLLEACQPIQTPLSEIQNTPLQFPFI